MNRRQSHSLFSCVRSALLFSVLAAGLARAALVYDLPFESAVGAQSLTNAGTAGGSGTLYNGSTTYSSSTPNASAWSMQWGSNYSGPYVELPSSTGQFTQPGVSSAMTVTGWVKWVNGTWTTIASKGSAAGWDVTVTGGGALRSQMAGGNRLSNPAMGLVQAGVWNQVAMVISMGQGLKFYINGQDAGTDGNSLAPYGVNTANAIWIGADSTMGSTPQGGSLDDVGLFDTALPAGKIMAIYNLATTAPLNYDLQEVSRLFDVYDTLSATGSRVGGMRWVYATGLSTAGGLGVVRPGGSPYSPYFLPLDGSGTGLIVVPEPASVALLGLAGMLVARRRR